MSNNGWKQGDFTRRCYGYESDSLDKAKLIEVIIKVDGKVIVQVQAREPGMIAVISKPDAQGIEVDMIEAARGRYIDRAVPDQSGLPQPWHFEAMGMTDG